MSLRPLGDRENGGVLAEATLTTPADTDLGTIRKLLSKLYFDFLFHNPGVQEAELSVTFNFILRGEGAGGSPSFSVFFGGDFTAASNDLSSSEVVAIHSAGDLDLVDLENLRQRETAKHLERNFEDSGISVERCCSYVFILRAYRNWDDHGSGRTGRQVALF